jgi:hypothetical protein
MFQNSDARPGLTLAAVAVVQFMVSLDLPVVNALIASIVLRRTGTPAPGEQAARPPEFRRPHPANAAG